MTIENLKQIAIKYASTKGSRVPLAPDELCNAVVQYMNSFFGVMTDINTIKVAVTEDSGNIVFTITGNTYDGKPITPIVITVDHNDFVTNQEFEEFKTTTNAAIQKNTESINSLSFRVEDTENDITTIQVQVGQINTRVGNTETNVTNLKNRVDNTETNVTNLKNRVDNTETNIAKINSTLENKVDVIKNPASNFVAYAHVNGIDTNVTYTEGAIGNTLAYRRASDGGFDVSKGISGKNAANMQNIADVEAKIPDVTNLADVTKENTFTDVNHFTQYITSFGVEVGVGNANDDEYDVSIQEYGIEIFHYISDSKSNSLRITENQIMTIVYPSNEYNIFDFPNKSGTLALTSDIPAIPEYTSVDSVIYDTTNGAIIAYNGANEIHIPLLAGENVTIDASEDNKKIVISAAGGGGAGDVTAAGNNIFTGENEFRNYTYDTSYFCFVDTKEDYLTNGYTTTIKNGGFDISYYENGEGKYWTTYTDNQIINKDIDMEGEVVIKFPKKNGTFALTSDIIKNPIYFISFYANEPSEPCHLIGTMMSKNSYGTGQKTNEEFAVMLADNLYTNSNEGLAAYGKLAGKDILCIYSEDGLSIRCLDEENSEVDLPTVMFFVMETEL